MRTFDVSAVEVTTSRRRSLDRGKAIRSLLSASGPIEDVYASDARLVACTNVSPLAQMAHDAFYEHRPIALSPDAVWFTLAQGFATHVNLNAEALRHRFVRHEGKRTLTVTRRKFFLGRPNPWPKMFAAFSTEIAAHVGKLRDLVVADFSTTGPLERAATEVLLMDTFQAYFHYEPRTGCGIPRVTLLGTPDDWRAVRRRAQMFSEFGLEHWTDVLLPVLDRIVATAEGADETSFWRSFFHYESGSMGQALTGWLNVLFPYLVDPRTKQPVPNPYMAAWPANFAVSPHGVKEQPGPHITELPSGLASAPVSVKDLFKRTTQEMRFVGGMFGVVQDEAGVLSPEFGWAVVYESPSEKPS